MTEMSDFFEEAVSMDQLFSTGAIRLQEISVYNWGSFHGLHTGSIHPDGTLITGDNGSGKSTFVDGLMALLLPPNNKNFNVAAAQGDRADRSLVSYVRGSYGTEHDGSKTNTLYKRPGAVASGLRALYRAEDGSQITLAAVFWTQKNTNALGDFRRLYVVAHRNVELPELLTEVENNQLTALKRRLSDDRHIPYCGDSFSAYKEIYRRVLSMDNENAPALLSRALGLKKIDDLTDLIRTLVLEPSQLFADASAAVTSFADLVGIHKELQVARDQQERLAQLPAAAQALAQLEHKIQILNEEQLGLPVWFGEQLHRLWGERIEALQHDIDEQEQAIAECTLKEEDLKAQEERYHEDYLQAGGDRIEALNRALERDLDKLQEVNQQAQQYQQATDVLGLNGELSVVSFNANLRLIEQNSDDFAQQKALLLAEYSAAANARAAVEKEQAAIAQQLKTISERPDSNIDSGYQQLRNTLCSTLNLPPEQLMFLAELVDVPSEHKAWQGAIERALGGLRTTLAVPQTAFSQVTRWLNQHHTGLHVRVQVVDGKKARAEFKPDGFLRKLTWRDHPYRDWLKGHLARHDLHCVDSTEQLDVTPFSMTQAGLVQLEKGRFEKKDQLKIDDRRRWYLGFSNTERLAILQHDLKQLSGSLSEHDDAVKTAHRALERAEQLNQQWQLLQRFSWDAIDVPRWEARVATLKADIAQLQASGGDLDQTKLRWQGCKQQLNLLALQQQRLHADLAVAQNNINGAQQAQSKANDAAATGLSDAVRERLLSRIGALAAGDIDDALLLQNQHQQQLLAQKSELDTQVRSKETQLTRIMSSFAERWPHISRDWSTGVEGIEDYLNFLQRLESEGLPTLVERFKERMNRHTTQALANISQKMASELEEIDDRIETINDVLRRTEFRPGSHLRLGSKLEDFDHVRHFKKSLRTILQLAGSDDHDARFNSLQQIIAILEKATDNPTTLESQRLLDSRYQLSFYAEEVENSSGRVLDVLASSTGKSGGEKEAFAGIIVAASLAYVLTPDGLDKPIYSTVFLDEAFSNTAESVSRRVLNVFKELNIHINLITPYKNLNLARESAAALLIAERDSSTHESHLCEVTWQQLDEQRAQQKQQQLAELDVASVRRQQNGEREVQC